MDVLAYLGLKRRPIPIIVLPKARLGNRMLQYMFCTALARRIAGAAVFNGSMPEWSIPAGYPTVPRDRTLRIEGGHEFDIDAIVRHFQEGGYRAIRWSGFAFRIGYYDREWVHPLFDGSKISAPRYGDDTLVIHIRAEDILDGSHENYWPLPFAYFDRLIDETGLRPVFIGQTHDDNEYCRRLRAHFAGAEFSPRASTVFDFEILRRATHVATSVSSFAWLGCWLSSAKTIHFPVAGFADPRQRPDMDVLPIGDQRYKFYLFDLGTWHASTDQFAYLFDDSGGFEPITHDQAAHLRKSRAVAQRP
jgi:hypothetical protein